MPYYLYRVLPFAQLEKLGEFAVFTQASAHAKALRADEREGGAVQRRGKIKLMFASNELQAEDLLCQIRDPGPAGDD